MSIREQLLADADDAAQQIKNMKQAGQSLYAISNDIVAALSEMELSLRAMQSKSFFINDPKLVQELEKLTARIERLRELRNMMELGSFSIQVDKAMQMAWEKLP